MLVMDRVLVRCQQCVDGKNSMAGTDSGRTAYQQLQPLIAVFEKEASDLTNGVQEIQELSKLLQARHQALTRAYGVQKSLDKARIEQAESRLKGKLLDIRKAKIAFALHRSFHSCQRCVFTHDMYHIGLMRWRPF